MVAVAVPSDLAPCSPRLEVVVTGEPPGRLGPARRRAHPAVVYRRRRIVVAGLLVALGLGVSSGVSSLFGAPSAPVMRPIAARVVVVRPGDTLWSIALAHDPRGNLLDLVDQLVSETHGRPLQVGQQVVVP